MVIQRASGRQKMRLGDLLVAQNIITETQLVDALALQKETNRKLGEVMVDEGITTEDAIAGALSNQLGLPYVNLNGAQIPENVISLVTSNIAKKYVAIPYKNDEENKKKYFHIAITSGKNPDELNEAIQFYLNENSIATAEEKPVMPIPPMEEITEKLSREEPKLVDCEIISIIYSRDKTKRFILFRSDKGFYKYTYEQIFVFDEEEWGIVSRIHENPYPAYWDSVDCFCARSFFGTEEDALSALKQETEYLQYFA